ncbi:unnamed protein product [Heligmosomoides polygyrus]|uniref:Transposase n=1 Tax=Heligmosomoides polygyrus TaxID=6339 RepID=A0A183FUW7_HELPZ|nr:unnamed protein product [Heligmosomoides polygyrus]
MLKADAAERVDEVEALKVELERHKQRNAELEAQSQSRAPRSAEDVEIPEWMLQSSAQEGIPSHELQQFLSQEDDRSRYDTFLTKEFE